MAIVVRRFKPRVGIGLAYVCRASERRLDTRGEPPRSQYNTFCSALLHVRLVPTAERIRGGPLEKILHLVFCVYFVLASYDTPLVIETATYGGRCTYRRDTTVYSCSCMGVMHLMYTATLFDPPPTDCSTPRRILNKKRQRVGADRMAPVHGLHGDQRGRHGLRQRRGGP